MKKEMIAREEMIARAWRDPAYRASLSAEELAQLPENPVGAYEVDSTMLESVVGGAAAKPARSAGWFCSVSAECWGFRCDLTIGI
jgi:mersacidin/lichenicidin family type 2 lantibiotic